MGHASGGLAAAIIGEVPTGVSSGQDVPRLPCATPECRNKAVGTARRRAAPKVEEEEAAEVATESGEHPVVEPKKKLKAGAKKRQPPNPALCRRCQNRTALEALSAADKDDEARLREMHAGYSRR